MWFWLALGSAVFAALTSILAKIGIEGVASNLATAELLIKALERGDLDWRVLYKH